MKNHTRSSQKSLGVATMMIGLQLKERKWW